MLSPFHVSGFRDSELVMGSRSLHHSALLSYYYVAPGHVGVCILVVSVVS